MRHIELSVTLCLCILCYFLLKIPFHPDWFTMQGQMIFRRVQEDKYNYGQTKLSEPSIVCTNYQTVEYFRWLLSSFAACVQHLTSGIVGYFVSPETYPYAKYPGYNYCIPLGYWVEAQQTKCYTIFLYILNYFCLRYEGHCHTLSTQIGLQCRGKWYPNLVEKGK